MSRLDKIDTGEYRKRLRAKILNRFSIFETQKVNSKDICDALNSILRLSISFKPLQTQQCKGTDFVLIGFYDAERDQFSNKKCITIYICEHLDRPKKLTKQRLQDLAYTITDCIIHELLHRRQSQRRDFIPNFIRTFQNDEKVVYLANPDEMESYAHNIASEMLDQYGHKSLEMLTNPKKIGINQHLDLYHKYFVGTPDEFMLRRLYKQIYKYMGKLGHEYINNT